GPWAADEVVLVAAPADARGLLAGVGGEEFVDGRDEIAVYREYPAVPLSAVPHLGPAGEAAYRAIPEATQCSPHSRLDITRWAGPDGE
ncbi:MAG: hypothetical protein K2X87_05000, partial [Gemmataceae bacterium]|nr:hypothetical protein [Gemmataceae bacterium]